MCDVMCKRVRSGGRDSGVPARGAKAQRRVGRIVVRVNQIVREARVIGMRRERLFESSGGLHVDRRVASTMRRSEERETVERGGVDVVRKRSTDAAHLLEIREVARLFVACAVQRLERAQIRTLPVCFAFGDSIASARAETLEDAARAAEILFHPHRMVLRHRLAPIGHGERRIDLLRLPERAGGIVVLEVVELSETVQERGLRGRRARILEGDGADARCLRADRHAEYRGKNGDSHEPAHVADAIC